MSYENGKGALFKNADKASDQHPDYRGEATIDSQPYRISVWLRIAKSGNRYMHLSFTPKHTDEIKQSVPRGKAFYDDPL
jgi:hypothetical protein